MPVAAPTNCWTYAESSIATAIANSAAFQAMTGTDNATDAAQHVYGEQLDEPIDGEAYTRADREQRHQHIAQVYSSTDQPYGKRRGASSRFEPFGVAVVYLERLATEVERTAAEVPQELERAFKNTVGDVIDQIIAYLDENGGPIVTGVTVEDGPGWNEQKRWKDDGAWQGCGMLVTWGIEQ